RVIDVAHAERRVTKRFEQRVAAADGDQLDDGWLCVWRNIRSHDASGQQHGCSSREAAIHLVSAGFANRLGSTFGSISTLFSTRSVPRALSPELLLTRLC